MCGRKENELDRLYRVVVIRIRPGGLTSTVRGATLTAALIRGATRNMFTGAGEAQHTCHDRRALFLFS